MAPDGLGLNAITTFGELLRHLRRRARLTQRELGTAVGYHYAHLARLERNERRPDVVAVRVRFVEALDLRDEPTLAQQLVALAEQAYGTLDEEAHSPATPHHQTNLLPALTRFIGREPAIAEVKCLIGAHRLVTLTGSGGVGKSRLAVEVAASLVGAKHRHTTAVHEDIMRGALPLQMFPDGVWLAEFAPLADPALIPQAVATVFHLPEQPNRSHLELLTTFLRDKCLLLILDNCEHLIQACAELTEALLRTCPQVYLLATSREALRVPGEVVWRVPSLSTPDPTHLPPLETVLNYEAVQLFLDRASGAQPNSELSPDNVAVIAQLCHRLDGIPLAIELAAARTHVLPAEHILAHLDDRFNLLTGGSRTALPRHQTLHAMIDWSFQLLTREEQRLFRRLAVFAGGWTLSAARAVTSAEDQESHGMPAGTPAPSTLQVLLRLVDKSLVYTRAEEGGEVRYAMLETIRAYALQQLVASGEAPLMRRQHASYFLAFAEQAEPKLHGPELLAWLNRLELEHDNLRAAFEWSQSADGNTTLGLRLAGALWWFWEIRGYRAEGRVWLTSALAQPGREPSLARARALNRLTFLAQSQDDVAVACTYLAESLPLCRALGDKRTLAEALLMQAIVTGALSEYEQSESLHAESLALFTELGDTWYQALTLASWSGICRWQGDYARAKVMTTRSLALYRALQDRAGIASLLYLMGSQLHAEGEQEPAEAFLAEGLALAQELSNRPRIALALGLQAMVARARQEYGRAEALLNKSLLLFRELGSPWGMSVALMNMGLTAHCQGDNARAEKLLMESLKLLSDEFSIIWVLMGMGNVAVARRQWARAVRLYGRVQARIDASGLGSSPDLREEYEHNLVALRAQLDPAFFDAAWAEGYAMTLDQAVAYALAD